MCASKGTQRAKINKDQKLINTIRKPQCLKNCQIEELEHNIKGS